ncbi:ATP-dependent DNA ligase [Mucilaginibacter sp. SG538B]|uniref:ATP dependent DNA ligase n=1 Tax=Mucilaginibacter sp. SG538B TaxID=2587021 RepID=UPI00159DB4CD|nr:hypothetical protein [Mucilaginibacter sp. SG538B]NVM66665.1 ATP-dependent DNA ligase [Mucilaginibacter sp. SG538B]
MLAIIIGLVLGYLKRENGGPVRELQTRFSDRHQKEVHKMMAEKLQVPKSPFINKVLDTKGAKIHYVKPELVANFEFATWTKTGRIRKPATFLG